MANLFLQYNYILIFLSFYVDMGDGHNKKTTKDTLKHDIDLYKKMIDRLNWDLETFYEEYPNDPSLDYYQDEINNYQKYIINNQQIKSIYKKNHKTNNVQDARQKKNVIGTLLNNDNPKQSNLPNLKNKYDNQNDNWPKFEDILINLGKKYDWKNDRWIKIKTNDKGEVKKESNLLKSIEFQEKHKFKYRIVKLNRTKSKRNIVIAVTAVR